TWLDGPDWAARTLFARSTLKAVPSVERVEGAASVSPLRPIMRTGRAPVWAMVTVWPFLVAQPLANWIVPKSSSVTVPRRPTLGASWIHSAEESDEVYWMSRSTRWEVE